MADSATTRNRFRKQEVGAKTNAWGTDWNEDGGSDRLDEALDGVVAFTLSGTTRTLTSTNYETDEARMRTINVTGGTGGTVVIPAVEKYYNVRNGATGDVTIYNGSNSIVVASGEVVSLITDGTNLYTLNAKTYVDAAILTASLSSSLPSQTGNAGKYITTDGTNASWASISLSTITGVLPILNGGTGTTSTAYCDLTANVSGALPVANGGTNITSYTTGDLIIATGATTLSKLADVATGNALISGGVGVAPSWGKIGISTHVSGLGTGIATALAANTGSAGAPVLFNGALGTPTSGALTNCTSVPVASATGTLAVGNGGTGQTTYTNGQLLIGNTTGNTLTKATLTAGNGVTVTNGGGSITLTTTIPQTENTGNNAVAFGTGAAGTATVAACKNSAVGYNSMANASGAGCIGNAGFGYNTLSSATFSASNSTAVGYDCGSGVTTGGSNTFLGASAGNSVTTGAQNTIVGRYQGSAALAGNAVLADGNFNRRFWHDGTDAYVSHATTASAANAYLDSGTSKLQRSTSSLRYKRDIEDLDAKEAEKLLSLRAVFYRSKCEADRTDWSYYGVIAEEADKLGLERLVQYEYAPEDMVRDEQDRPVPNDGAQLRPSGFAYDRMTVLLLKLVQQQEERIRALEAR